jgi:hypothetical protein
MFFMTLSISRGETQCEERLMRAKEALALLNYADSEFLAVAGPAVLRLKLLEVTHLASSRRLPADMREAARLAALELRKLISERPCVSLIDYEAKEDLANGGRAAEAKPFIFPRSGRA